MSRISIAEIYEAPEVDLWGHVFVVRPFTKHMEEKWAGLEAEVRAKFDEVENGEDLVATVGKYFDVVLKRVETNGGRQSRPSTLLKQKWNSSELSVEQLTQFFIVVFEESGKVPPT